MPAMEQGRLGMGLVSCEELFSMPLHLRDGKQERGLGAGSSVQGAHGVVFLPVLPIVSIPLLVSPQTKWSCVRMGACAKRGGALELFGSVLEADGLPLAGDSWLLHPKGVLKGIGLAPKPKELLTY